MHIRHTLDALPLVAQMLAGNYDVRVRITGDQAYTDGDTITLPFMPVPQSSADHALAERFIDFAWGYLAHEVGHVKFTDFKVLPDSPLEHAFVNVLEDVRIERVMGDQFPGAKRDLNRLWQRMSDEGKIGTPSASSPPAELLVAHVMNRLRSTELGQGCFDERAVASRGLMLERFGAAITTKVHALIAGTADALDTAAIGATARALLAMLEEQSCEPPAQDSESPDGDVGDTGSGPGGESDTYGEPDANPESPAEPAPAAARAALREALKAAPDTLPQDPLTAVQAAMGEARDEAEDAGVPIARTEVETGRGGSESYPLSLEPGAVSVDRTRCATAKLRTRLHGRLQALADCPNDPVVRGGRLDASRLWRAPLPGARIFRRHQEDVVTDTAVLLLLDRSSSMSGERIDVARHALYATALAMESIDGVSVAAAAFPGTDFVLRFGDRVAGRHDRFAVSAAGGTPLADALWQLLPALLAREEPRKLLVVLSDGAPDDPDAAKLALGAAIRAGIEVLGLGIQTHALASLIPNSGAISHVDELPGALLGALETTLTHRRVA